MTSRIMCASIFFLRVSGPCLLLLVLDSLLLSSFVSHLYYFFFILFLLFLPFIYFLYVFLRSRATLSQPATHCGISISACCVYSSFSFGVPAMVLMCPCRRPFSFRCLWGCRFAFLFRFPLVYSSFVFFFSFCLLFIVSSDNPLPLTTGWIVAIS